MRLHNHSLQTDSPVFRRMYRTLSLLARANLIDLHFAFGLKEETAKKLLAWQKGHQPTSLDDYETAHVLTEAEIDKLKSE